MCGNFQSKLVHFVGKWSSIRKKDTREGNLNQIGFKPAKWNPSDLQWWEGGQEDLMIECQKRQTDPAEWGLIIWK